MIQEVGIQTSNNNLFLPPQPRTFFFPQHPAVMTKMCDSHQKCPVIWQYNWYTFLIKSINLWILIRLITKVIFLCSQISRNWLRSGTKFPLRLEFWYGGPFSTTNIIIQWYAFQTTTFGSVFDQKLQKGNTWRQPRAFSFICTIIIWTNKIKYVFHI